MYATDVRQHHRFMPPPIRGSGIISFMSGDIWFHEFLFAYLFFLPDTDVFITLLQLFVCCISHAFRL